jgi:hypothetical protein
MTRWLLPLFVAVVAFAGAFGIARALSGGGTGTAAPSAPTPQIARATAGHPAIAAVPATTVPALRHVRHRSPTKKVGPTITPPPDQVTPKPPSPPTPKPKPKPKPTPFE